MSMLMSASSNPVRQITDPYTYTHNFIIDPSQDLILLAVSVLMSGLDEMLRQVLLHCQVSTIDIPFNNFQSKRDIE
jgi:hypothetical protein